MLHAPDGHVCSLPSGLEQLPITLADRIGECYAHSSLRVIVTFDLFDSLMTPPANRIRSFIILGGTSHAPDNQPSALSPHRARAHRDQRLRSYARSHFSAWRSKVSVAKVLEQPVNEWDEFTGRLEAPETVEVRPRVSGQIDQVAFTDGSLVKKGDLLFQIDPRPFQSEVRRLEAQLQQARAVASRSESEAQRGGRLAQHLGARSQSRCCGDPGGNWTWRD